MIIHEKQSVTIDSLLATHRELTAVELCDYKIQSILSGGVKLTVKSGSYWYSYKILASGAITEMRKSENGYKFPKVYYFEND